MDYGNNKNVTYSAILREIFEKIKKENPLINMTTFTKPMQESFLLNGLYSKRIPSIQFREIFFRYSVLPNKDIRFNESEQSKQYTIKMPISSFQYKTSGETLSSNGNWSIKLVEVELYYMELTENMYYRVKYIVKIKLDNVIIIPIKESEEITYNNTFDLFNDLNPLILHQRYGNNIKMPTKTKTQYKIGGKNGTTLYVWKDQTGMLVQNGKIDDITYETQNGKEYALYNIGTDSNPLITVRFVVTPHYAEIVNFAQGHEMNISPDLTLVRRGQKEVLYDGVDNPPIHSYGFVRGNVPGGIDYSLRSSSGVVLFNETYKSMRLQYLTDIYIGKIDDPVSLTEIPEKMKYRTVPLAQPGIQTLGTIQILKPPKYNENWKQLGDFTLLHYGEEITKEKMSTMLERFEHEVISGIPITGKYIGKDDQLFKLYLDLSSTDKFQADFQELRKGWPSIRDDCIHLIKDTHWHNANDVCVVLWRRIDRILKPENRTMAYTRFKIYLYTNYLSFLTPKEIPLDSRYLKDGTYVVRWQRTDYTSNESNRDPLDRIEPRFTTLDYQYTYFLNTDTKVDEYIKLEPDTTKTIVISTIPTFFSSEKMIIVFKDIDGTFAYAPLEVVIPKDELYPQNVDLIQLTARNANGTKVVRVSGKDLKLPVSIYVVERIILSFYERHYMNLKLFRHYLLI